MEEQKTYDTDSLVMDINGVILFLGVTSINAFECIYSVCFSALFVIFMGWKISAIHLIGYIVYSFKKLFGCLFPKARDNK